MPDGIGAKGTMTGVNGLKTLDVYFNAAIMVSIGTSSVSAVGDFIFEAEIVAQGALERVSSAELRGTSAANVRCDIARNTTDLGAGDLIVRLGVNLANAADTVAIESVEVWETG